MAETKVKPYTFLNSSIVGKGNEPDTQSAKRVVLSFNRLGSTLVSIGKIQEQKLSLIKTRNIWANQRKNILTKLQENQAIKTKAFSESLKSLRAAKDKESEKKQESMDVPDANKVSGEVKKEAEEITHAEAAFIISKLRKASYIGTEFEQFYNIMAKLTNIVEQK